MPCAPCMLHFLRITITRSHTHAIQQAHTHKAVTRRAEANKLLSCRRQSYYSVVHMHDWRNVWKGLLFETDSNAWEIMSQNVSISRKWIEKINQGHLKVICQTPLFSKMWSRHPKSSVQHLVKRLKLGTELCKILVKGCFYSKRQISIDHVLKTSSHVCVQY